MKEKSPSGIGIASFIISLLSGIMLFVLVVIAGILEVSSSGGMDEESIAAVLVGLFLLLFIGTSVLGFGLGIGGLFQSSRKRVFAVLGTLFASINIFSLVALFILGIALG